MTPEKFKRSDAIEQKFVDAGSPVLDTVGLGLDDFYTNGYEATPFLLMLYDEKRIPFAERIAKEAFVEFVREALDRFSFVGTFDFHLFILRAIFGELSYIAFDVPSPGILHIDVNATSSLEFDFVGGDGEGGVDEIVTDEGDQIVFRGIAGIETAAELELLFSEIIPAGLSPNITLSFYERFTFIAEDPPGEFHTMVDHLNNELIFTEVGT